MAKRGRAVRRPPVTRKRAPVRKRATSAIDHKKENANLRRELIEARQQQTATADVLKVISRSTFDLQTVLDTLTELAARLCNADMAAITRQGELGYYHATNYNLSVDWIELTKSARIVPGRESVVGRALLESRAVQIADVLADPEYAFGEFQKAAGYRTLLGVPLLRAGQPIGVLFLGRKTVEPFTDKQIELVSTFADQAVIAIENVRLFDEVQTRTRELAELLEQQTATSEVLEIISSTPGELEPVFKSMLENATRICDAKIGILWKHEDGAYTPLAVLGVTPAYREYLYSGPIRAGADTGLGRVASTKQTIHVVDVRSEPAYLNREPLRVATAELGGVRSQLNVPMLKDNELVGAIAIFRQEVRPFTDKQIDLVSNFAKQAVIAIENTRLLKELHARTEDLGESLQQQTATADVLKVISRSAFDLEFVLATLVASAAKLCEAERGLIFLRQDNYFRMATNYGFSPELEAFAKANPFPVDSASTTICAAMSGSAVQAVDVLTDETQGWLAREYQRLGDHRTNLGVPLRRNGETIGVFTLTRQVVRPFTEKQIELVSTFADQAVIAIENVRLFDEVQARTEDLRELLQQQTATADVLKVISRSTFDLQTVLDTLLESATRLCDAEHAWLFQRENELLHWVASYGHATDVHARIRDHFMSFQVPLNRGSVTGRTVLEARVVHVPDVLADPEYTLSEVQKIGRYRAALGVPLLRGGNVVGVIFVAKTVPQPFTSKQIELVATFADQALIAIENTRLLNEQRESLQQQTATADVLKVISRSAFDLPTVLQTLVELAARLCDADKATITRQKDGSFYRAESFGFSREFMDYVRDIPVAPDRGSATGRALLEGVVVHIPDVQTDPDYRFDEALKLGNYRTLLGVPMLREGVPIGVIALTRSEPRPFTDKQIELVDDIRRPGCDRDRERSIV